MKHLLIIAVLSGLFLLAPNRAEAQRYGYYNRSYRPGVSNVWHPRSSAYLSRPTYQVQPYRFGPVYRPNYYNYNRGRSFNAQQIYNARPYSQYNARPSFQYNARPSNRFNARPSF